MTHLEPITHPPIEPIPAAPQEPVPQEPTVPATEPVTPQEDKDEIIATLREALLIAKAQAVCARLGVSEARASYVLRLANLSAIDDPLTADAAIRESIHAVLTDVPELRGGGTGVSGAFRARRAPAKDAFERGFERK